MSILEVMLAALVPIIWGTSTAFIKIGLVWGHIPIFLFLAMRFLLASSPLLFIRRRPQTSFRKIFLVGATLGFGQLLCIVLAIKLGTPIGVIVILLQIQAFIVPFFAFFILKERIRFSSLIGMSIATVGLVMLLMDVGFNLSVHTTLDIGLLFVLAGAIFMALGSVLMKHLGKVEILLTISWISFVPVIPFFVLSFIFEPHSRIYAVLFHPNVWVIVSLSFTAFVATTFAFSLWNKLLSRHPATLIAPFVMIGPIAGMLSGHLLFKEVITFNQIIAALLIILGLAAASFFDYLVLRFKSYKLSRK